LAWASPELSPRDLALKLTDTHALSVSESTVYRLLKRRGLVKTAEVLGFKAAKEYHPKTTRPNEMWATDGAYLKMVGRGYYLVTVLDDYSRFILAWRLQPDMTATSLIDVVQEAVQKKGLAEVPLRDCTALLSDHGPGYLSLAFAEYLRLVGLRRIVAFPYHPQTNRKIERYRRTVKSQVYPLVYETPTASKQVMVAFADYYNHRRYHEGLGNVTPADVYYGRREEILRRKKEVKQRILALRKQFHRAGRDQEARRSVH
jgi:putative transposase